MRQLSRQVRILALCAIVSLGFAAGVAAGSLSGAGAQDSSESGFVGAWWLAVTRDGQPPSPNLTTMTSDGIILTSNPTVGPAVEGLPADLMVQTTGHGSWIATGERNAAITFEVLVTDVDGNYLGLRSTDAAVELDATGDAWTGAFIITYADPVGDVVQTVAGTVEATRITADPMALDLTATPAADAD